MFTPIKIPIAKELYDSRSVHIVDLAPFKASAGALWPEISAGVCSRFENILKKRLMPTDYYEKATDTRYVIVTPKVENDDGALFAYRAASEFETALNGHCDPTQLRIMRGEWGGSGRIKCVPMRADALATLADRHLPSEGEANLRRGPSLHSQTRSRLTPDAGQCGGIAIKPRFEPIWDAKNQAITTYLCAPAAITCEVGGVRRELTPEDLTPRERTTVELACLRAGVGSLSRCVESGDRFLLGVSVSFETLCAPNGRMDFAGICRGLPGIYRQYLNFILGDVPLGVTQSRLADLAMVLRPFGNIIATVASGCRSFTSYDGLGFSSLALDINKAPADSERIRADIIHVGSAGRTTRHGALILNAPDRSTLNMATAADFQFLHGRAVGAPLPAPKRMTRLAATAVLPESADAGSEEWF